MNTCWVCQNWGKIDLDVLACFLHLFARLLQWILHKVQFETLLRIFQKLGPCVLTRKVYFSKKIYRHWRHPLWQQLQVQSLYLTSQVDFGIRLLFSSGSNFSSTMLLIVALITLIVILQNGNKLTLFLSVIRPDFFSLRRLSLRL